MNRKLKIENCKFVIGQILAVLLMLALTISLARAQTDTNAPPLPVSSTSFFQTATLYFTSFNTNYDWNARGEASAGIASMQDGAANLANELRFGYNLDKRGRFSLETTMRDSGVEGTIVSQQGGVGVNFPLYDAKLTLYAHAGYHFHEAERWYGELGARVSKKMTKYTFMGVGLGAEIPRGSRVFTAFAGFTF